MAPGTSGWPGAATTGWPDVGTRAAVVALTLFALCLRLFDLGARAVHWDEARVGYWVLRWAVSGTWEYHPILHGPFLKHVSRGLVSVLGATPATIRLPVAVVGGLLPLAALAFRARLSDRETVALALVLAVDPLLLYFSRFMRSDVLVAAFAFGALAAFVRLVDTRRVRWLYAGAGLLALAFTAKENAVLYLLSWLGAGTLVATRNLLVLPAGRRRPALDERAAATLSWARGWWGHLLLSGLLFAVVVVFFYAPRSGTPGGVGIYNALGNPALFPAVLEAATLGSWRKLSSVWLSPDYHSHSYVPYLAYYALLLALASAAVSAFALLGGIRERTRDLVAFCGWWGLSGVVGYPYVTDITAPWLAVHIVVALSVPAAVGLVAVWTRLRGALAGDDDRAGDRVVAAAMAGLLLVAGAHVGVLAATTSYSQPPAVWLVAQTGQPGSDLNPTMRRVQRVGREHPGADVLYVGDLAVETESGNDDLPAEPQWYARLPLPWYTEAAGLNVTSVADPAAIGPDPPPVVVALADDRAAVAAELSGYDATEESLLVRPHDRTVTVFGIERRLLGESVVVFVRNGTD